MDRREFLKTTGLAATAAATTTTTAAASSTSAPVSAPAILPNTRELHMAMAWPDAVSGQADCAHRLASRIEEATDRRYRIRITAENSNAAVTLAKGEADLYHASEHDNADLDAAFSYFAGLPFSAGLAPGDLASWLAIGGGQELWDELAAEHGFKPLLAGHTGQSPRLWSNRPIGTLGDFKDLRISAYGPTADVMRAIGAETVAMPSYRLAAALRDRDIDAAEFGGALQAMAAGVAPAGNIALETVSNGAGTAITLGISTRLWDGMSQSDRTIFTACAGEAYRLAVSENEAHEKVIMKTLTDLHGVTTASLTADARAALRSVTEAVVATLASTTPRAQRVNASYMAFRRTVSPSDLATPSTEIPLV